MDENELVSVSETAAWLGVTSQSVETWIKRGYIPAYRIGPSLIRLRRADVEAMLVPIEVSA